MAFVLPTFNLTALIYDNSLAIPPLAAPRLTTPACLAWGRRVQVTSTGGTPAIGVPVITMNLLLPRLTDIRGYQSGPLTDIVEVPSGSGRWYEVTSVDDLGKGFANEHRCALILAVAPWTMPYN